jgi:lipopolysaccharide export system protein LptA
MQETRFYSAAPFILQCFILAGILLAGPAAFSQKRVKLKQADNGKSGKKDGERFDRLIGNVILTHEKTTIYCDSAHLYKKKNIVEAYGHVHIVEGDSVDITGARLEYNGNTKTAKLRNNVVFTKLATATLYTENHDFSRAKNLAHYFSGGKLVDSINVLTSSKGYYTLNSNLASFKKNVKVKNPDYTMTADSLQYNSRTKVIYFVTETTVVNKDSSTFVYRGGKYNTQSKVSDIKEGTGESEAYTIVGDRYDYDGIRNVGKVRDNVVMTSKKENLIIYGHASDYFKSTGITKIYDRAFIAKVGEQNDTLFISADTLVSIDSKDEKKKRLLAYNNVKIFRNDMQGVADSLEYRSADSTIYFYNKPILWSDDNQMTADSIRMLIKNNTISRIYMIANSFVVSQDTLLNFNQIKGRKMIAEFKGGQMDQVLVQGNGESLYYILDEKDMSFTGMNKIICSNITIRFKEGKVNNLSFYVKPDAQFIPPHELKEDQKTLKGFEWKQVARPERKDVVKPIRPYNANRPAIKKTVQ